MDWLEEKQDNPKVKYTYLPDSEIFMHSEHCHKLKWEQFVLPLSPKYNIQHEISILFVALPKHCACFTKYTWSKAKYC